VAADDDLKKYIRDEYFEYNSPQKNPFTNPLRTLVIFTNGDGRSHERAAEGIAPRLKGLGLKKEVPVLSMRSRSNRLKRLTMPNGNWNKHLGAITARAANNFVTIGASQPPIRTFMLPIH
jgi:hypothetical protein